MIHAQQLDAVLGDERPAAALAALAAMENGAQTFVPAHGWVEVAHGLVMAERRKRASQADVTEALNLLSALPVATDDETAPRAVRDTVAVARQYRLTVYDAAYLELAMRRGAPLASADEALLKVARSAGVAVLA